jgi:hypothetical protein
MSTAPPSDAICEALTLHVPLSFRRRGGRKMTLAADDRMTVTRSKRPVATPVVLAIAKAFRWRHLLESGKYATIREIAVAERVNESYLSRVLRLTLLAPDIVETLLKVALTPSACARFSHAVDPFVVRR